MASGLTILVTGDEANLRRTLALILRCAGYVVFTAEHARQALRRLAARPYDLVILDLNTPDLNDLSLLAEIRQSYPNLPVLILTACASPESIIGIQHTGSLEYLVKPIDPAYILARMQDMLGKPVPSF